MLFHTSTDFNRHCTQDLDYCHQVNVMNLKRKVIALFGCFGAATKFLFYASAFQLSNRGFLKVCSAQAWLAAQESHFLLHEAQLLKGDFSGSLPQGLGTQESPIIQMSHMEQRAFLGTQPLGWASWLAVSAWEQAQLF